MTSVTGSSSVPVWQKLYQASLYRFSPQGREEVLDRFRVLNTVGSASCTFDAHHDLFEINCLTSDAVSAQGALTQIISEFVDEQAQKSRDESYIPKASKYAEAINDDGHPDRDIESDDESPGHSKQLIDFDHVAIKDYWIPADPTSQLEVFCSVQDLAAIGTLTGCQLSLDPGNRRVAIKPSSAPNIDGAKRKLTNIEAISTAKPLVAHYLNLQKTLDVTLAYYRIRHPKDSTFNEDGTLSRLLVSHDSPILEIRSQTDPGRILESLYVMRYFLNQANLKPPYPQRRDVQPIKPGSRETASQALASINARDISDTPATSAVIVEASKPTTDRKGIERWIGDIESNAPSQPEPKHIEAVNEIVQEREARKPQAPVSAQPPRTISSISHSHSQAPQSYASTITQRPAPSHVWTSASARPESVAWGSKSVSQVSSQHTAKPTPFQLPKAPRASFQQTKNQAYRNSQPPKGKQIHQRPQPVKGSENAKSKPKDRPASTKQPRRQEQKPVTSRNTFAALRGLDGGDDNEEEAEDSDDVVDQLADEEEKPTFLRVNRQKAAAPILAPPHEMPSLIDMDDTTDWPQHSSVAPVEDVVSREPPQSTANALSSSSILSQNTLNNGLNTISAALERARAAHGSVEVRAQIGQIVLKDVPKDARQNITKSNFTERLDSITKHGTTFHDSFTPNLTTETGDIDAVLEMLCVSDPPIHTAKYFEFTCQRSDMALFRVVVDAKQGSQDQPAKPFVRWPESTHGLFFAHCPQRVWDSRIVVSKYVNMPLDAFTRTDHFVESLYVRAKDGGLQAEGHDEGVEVKQTRLYTSARWALPHSISKGQDLFVEVKEVADLPVLRRADTQGQFMSPYLGKDDLVIKQRFWYEISFGLVTPNPKLLENEPHPEIRDPARPPTDPNALPPHLLRNLEWGEKASWKPHEILTPEQFVALHEVACKAVEKMDGVGAGNRGFGAPREEAAIIQRRELEKRPDVFW